MIGHRTSVCFALMCALVLCAVAAQGASAAGKGQTIFECSKEAPIRPFNDAHCDTEGSAHEYGHVQFPEASTAITLTNGATAEETKKATIWIWKIALLHGFKNVVLECTNVEGTGTAKNSEETGTMKGSGSSTIKFNNGTGVLCHTNQSGCEGGTATVGAKVAEVKASFETAEGTTLKEGGVAGGHGLKFFPTSGNFTTITFEGTCGLHAFGAIPISGSFIGTAGGTREGHGATTWFIEGEMSSVTLGGEPMQVIGKLTLKRTSTGNALTLTTS
jgi:hypothetical protein